MNIYEIHFLMLVLGILAGLFVAGRFRRASKRRNPYIKSVRHWPIGIATMLVIALSPFSRFIPSLPFNLSLLTQSFLFSALGLFIIVLFDTIVKSFRTRGEEPHYRPGAGHINTNTVQRQSYQDTAAPNQLQAIQTQRTESQHNAVTVDKSTNAINESTVSDAMQNELSETMTAASQTAEPIQDSLDEAKAELANTTTETDVTKELQNLGEELTATAEPVQEIDLAEQAAEMDSIRKQLNDDVVLPSDNSWQETQTELDLTQEMMPKDSPLASTDESGIETAAIEDAEVVAEQSVSEFRNDITGDYNSPSHSYTQSVTSDDMSEADEELNTDIPAIPETLQDALKVSKDSTEKLQSKIDTLDTNLRELTQLQTSTAQLAESRAQEMLERKQALVQSQDETQAAAESVIEVQTALLKRARRQHELVALKLEQERKELAAQRVEILRTRAVAQKAALLARKASQAQQATRDIAKREQNARMASQEKARKAVLIARNAISALAEEERKRGLTRH